MLKTRCGENLPGADMGLSERPSAVKALFSRLIASPRKRRDLG